MPTYPATIVIFSHATGKRHDVSPFCQGAQASATMQGTSVGSWGCTVKVESGDKDDQGYKVRDLFEGYVRDDDWCEYEIDGDKGVGLVAQVDIGESTDPTTGVVRRVYTVSGSSWGRCMLTQIRMLSLFASPVTVTRDVLPPYQDEITPESNPAVQQSAAVPIQQYGTGYPDIPGFLDETSRKDILGAIFTPVQVGVDVAPAPLGPDDPYTSQSVTVPVLDPAHNDAGRVLRSLLEIVMEGLWTDPAGTALVDRLKPWPKFDKITGYAWQLTSLASMPVLTPDQILRQYLCEAFTEVFYDYLTDKNGASTGKPAVYVRPRPFSAWGSLPRTIIPADAITGVRLGRSGDERFNFWNPDSPLTSSPGVTRLIDTGSGKLPIVDASSIATHGVRPAEPSDTMWPPSMKQTQPVLDWHRARIVQFFQWYAGNPEMLTGMVAAKGSFPAARIGTVIRFPYRTKFRVNGQVQDVTEVEGYVVGVSRSTSVAGNGALQSNVSWQIIRGQPVGGLPVPDAPSWRVATFTAGRA